MRGRDTHSRQAGGRVLALRTRRRVAAACLACCLLAATAAIARADDTTPVPSDLGVSCAAQTQTANPNGYGCDTEYTPVAKDSTAWVDIGGAKFGDKRVPAASPTPLTVDFFADSFLNEDHGFFAGAACRDSSTGFDQLDSCERVPAIYEYRVPPGQPAEINEVLGPKTGEGAGGYVAAVAWIGPHRALAVGGTGHYPRRELARQPGESDADYAARDFAGSEPNAAGRARAWLYSDGNWQELEDLPKTQDGTPMGGLTALDCTPRPADDHELCVAGGMRQLWIWREGRFAESVTPTSMDAEGKPSVDGGPAWHYRVRAIRFVPGSSIGPNATSVVAVTSGCCGADATHDSASFVYAVGDSWRARPLLVGKSDATGNARGAFPDSAYGLLLPGGDASVVMAAGEPANSGTTSEPAGRVLSLALPGPDPPDTVVANQRIHEDDGTQASESLATCLGKPTASGCRDTFGPTLTSARLVSGDGDFAAPPTANAGAGGPLGRFFTGSGVQPQPDGLMDWAVGVLGSSGQAIAYTTTQRGALPNPTDCTYQQVAGGLTSSVLTRSLDASVTKCRPADVNAAPAETKSQSLYKLPAYALNTFVYTPGGGTGWAAGDKGAILRLGGSGTVGAAVNEAPPPRLGGHSERSLADTAPYREASPPLASRVGTVPGLADQPSEKLSEPRLVPAGTPDPTRPAGDPLQQVNSIAMSRDGSEGWAVGPGATATAQGTLFHYDGQRWSRCDPEGMPGQVQPDPACRSFAGLRLNRDSSKSPDPTQLTGVVRVPLENDADPSNDDQFEAVAIGTGYFLPRSDKELPLVARYSHGEWSIDDQAMREIAPDSLDTPFLSVAFTAPDDGWITSGVGSPRLYHYDGRHWIGCNQDVSACGGRDGAPALLASNTDLSVVGGYLSTAGQRIYFAGTRTVNRNSYPVIDTKDPGQPWRVDFDPGCVSKDATGACVASGAAADQGTIDAISVARDGRGRFFGWAMGVLGPGNANGLNGSAIGGSSQLTFLRLDPESGKWALWPSGDVASDYGPDYAAGSPSGSRMSENLLALTGPDGVERAFVAASHGANDPQARPMLRFDGKHGRWQVLPSPFTHNYSGSSYPDQSTPGIPQAMAPDGQGGFWVAVRGTEAASLPYGRSIFFYHYTDRAPKTVFEDFQHPVREPITAAAGGGDSSFWVATSRGVVYRYDRVTGWDRAPIPGWDPGRVVSNPSPVTAIAVGRDGAGVAVGPGGRIADIGPGQVRLDPAAGRALCDPANPVPPCATSRDLTAAAVAPDGSAMVAGRSRALLWRPARGQFRMIVKPNAPVSASFTGVAMPSPDRAWLATDAGQIWLGSLTAGGWSWQLDNMNSDGELVNLNRGHQGIALNAIAVDGAGHGYAVGPGGLVLERHAGEANPWRRIDSGVLSNLYTVALPQSSSQGDSGGALIGGMLGLILTASGDHLSVARTDDYWDPLVNSYGTDTSGPIVGLALLPGQKDGQAEAWAALQDGPYGRANPGPSALLHYSSTPTDTLLSAGERANPLPDAAPSNSEAISFATFGRSDCHLSQQFCPEMQGSNLLNEVIPRRIVADVTTRADAPGGPAFALFTGDVARTAGDSPLNLDLIHRRWKEFIADPLQASGVPLFAALGGQDLSPLQYCQTPRGCTGSNDAGAGTTNGWRSSFAGMPAPWGSGDPATTGSLSFDPVKDSADEAPEAPGGGARTHYAIDIKRGGVAIARLVVADTSLKSLTTSDATQNPVEDQATWLRQVLCIKGSSTDTAQTPCTREASERAIVVSNDPTYSYNSDSSAGGTETETDAAAFEQLMLDNKVSVVVSGRLGWNGLYYLLATGVHDPSPGGSYPAEAPPPISGSDPIPFVISSSAGGTFGPIKNKVDGSASDGYWHGYAIVHLDLHSGAVTVEQRPILDWVGIQAKQHVLRPQQTLTLSGYGREAVGMEVMPRYDEISNAAITHCYDLVLANPQKPWLPLQADDASASDKAKGGGEGCRSRSFDSGGVAASAQDDECRPYICVNSGIGTIDPVTGEVKAGSGNQQRTFTIAILSVGDHVATWPLSFEPRPSFRQAPAPPPLPIPPAAAPPPAPAPPAPAPPFNPPTLTTPPPLAPLPAQTPPIPPVPPAPPNGGPAQLDLFTSPPVLSVAPSISLFPPSPPVINVAPPTPARPVEKAKKVAVQSSGSDSDAKSEANKAGVDLAQDAPGATGSAYTRNDPQAFTAITHRDQASAWARDLQWGGGLTLMALVAAFGWITVRPTPRRKTPEVPAPAQAWSRSRRR
jgi:hypothetical protein